MNIGDSGSTERGIAAAQWRCEDEKKAPWRREPITRLR